jgi:hypothetical protein
MEINDEEEDNSWCKLIIGQCDNYLIYLPAQYSCICTKAFHSYFNTVKKQEQIKKEKNIKLLKLKLEKERCSHLEICNFIFQKIGPFNDEYGKNFSRSCEIILLPKLIRPTCISCKEEKVCTVFIPCGHAVYCPSCIEKSSEQKALVKCPTCRALVKELLPWASLKKSKHCLTCKVKKPNILYKECMHLAQCSDCAKDFCPPCKQNRKESYKIFLEEDDN